MTEQSFTTIVERFLNGYWGAFHEALEAQSVTPRRLAGSLFDALQAGHRAFAEVYDGPAKDAVEGLGAIWTEVHARRYQYPDAALTQEQIAAALRLFVEIDDSLREQGARFPEAWNAIQGRATHGTPRDPLRADVAR